ncbi:sigma 54-interacting transcriptional regulator [Brevibacillus massiliensis]|uniref:sigma 54-interacting transcriptional regulator n=1 Tax=Brevibacillus massiliensis TaxID=1118054 RepID=UPI00030EDBC3|nr:sigma 54-interacting transcriptional regulator [Brevibacillus massiliensis]
MQRFLADLTPIVDQQIVTWAVVSLYDYENMKQLAFEFTNSNRKNTFADIICETPVMKNIKSKAAHFAKSSSTILKTGESGTGKEMFARAIHEASPRADQPFISINCGAKVGGLRCTKKRSPRGSGKSCCCGSSLTGHRVDGTERASLL